MNTWFIMAQIFGAITMGFEFACYQIKDKRRYFLVTGVASFFWALMFISMGMATSMDTQLSLVLAGTYSTVRNLVFWRIFKDDSPKAKKAGRIFLVFMMIVGITAGITTVMAVPEQVRWIHALGLLTAMTFVVGQYLPGDHWVRITVIFYAVGVILTQTPLNILEGDFRWNVMGILIEMSKIVSVLIFYGAIIYRNYRLKKLKKLKYEIATEIARIDTMSEKIPVANVPGVAKVHRLVAKMMRYELLTIAQDKIKDADSAQDEIKGVLEDLEVIQSLKLVLNKG